MHMVYGLNVGFCVPFLVVLPPRHLQDVPTTIQTPAINSKHPDLNKASRAGSPAGWAACWALGFGGTAWSQGTTSLGTRSRGRLSLMKGSLLPPGCTSKYPRVCRNQQAIRSHTKQVHKLVQHALLQTIFQRNIECTLGYAMCRTTYVQSPHHSTFARRRQGKGYSGNWA